MTSPHRERMLAGLDLRERRLNLAGVATAVLEAGEGPPLVLLHGGIECGAAYWAPVVPELARRHRLVMPDLPGFGESEPYERLDHDTFGPWLAELVEVTCAGEAPALLAHSLVGTLAARFAAGRGDLLRSLCVYSSPGVGPYRIPLGLKLRALPFAIHPSERTGRRMEAFALLDRERTRARDPEWHEAFSSYLIVQARKRHVARAMRQLLKTGTKHVPDAELRAIELPVALVWARGDRMTRLELGVEASERLGWPLELIDDAAHVPHMEQPQAFVAAAERALSPQAAAV